jgi:hypothetical protein
MLVRPFRAACFEMGKQAAESGVTLSQFGDMVKQNSTIMAQMGGAGAFGQLTKSVRGNIQDFGQFGYTVKGITDLTHEYMETLRLNTRLEDTNTQTTIKGLIQLGQRDLARVKCVWYEPRADHQDL